jgi:hypothetical protein
MESADRLPESATEITFLALVSQHQDLRSTCAEFDGEVDRVRSDADGRGLPTKPLTH